MSDFLAMDRHTETTVNVVVSQGPVWPSDRRAAEQHGSPWDPKHLPWKQDSVTMGEIIIRMGTGEIDTQRGTVCEYTLVVWGH